jgi:hypothetical protein
MPVAGGLAHDEDTSDEIAAGIDAVSTASLVDEF